MMVNRPYRSAMCSGCHGGMGPEVAARFLDMYGTRRATTFEYDGYWDVVTLVDFLADVAPASPLPRREVDRLERYLAGVLAEL
jgi:hypothetical protein